MNRSVSLISALFVLAAASGGCLGVDPQPYAPITCTDSTGAHTYSTCRVWQGRLQLPHPSLMQLSAKAFQIGALAQTCNNSKLSGDAGSPAADGGSVAADSGASSGHSAPCTPLQGGQRIFIGAPFAYNAGAGQQPSIPFSIVVPCELSVNLLLQLPRSGQAGIQVAQLSFPSGVIAGASTTLIPWQSKDSCANNHSHQLGQVTLTKTKASMSGVITLGQGNSKNPLSLLDTDGDGTADLSDADDDDDGTADISDPDVSGDGVRDASQTLASLPDKNKDGIPDLFQ